MSIELKCSKILVLGLNKIHYNSVMSLAKCRTV